MIVDGFEAAVAFLGLRNPPFVVFRERVDLRDALARRVKTWETDVFVHNLSRASDLVYLSPRDACDHDLCFATEDGLATTPPSRALKLHNSIVCTSLYGAFTRHDFIALASRAPPPAKETKITLARVLLHFEARRRLAEMHDADGVRCLRSISAFVRSSLDLDVDGMLRECEEATHVEPSVRIAFFGGPDGSSKRRRAWREK